MQIDDLAVFHLDEGYWCTRWTYRGFGFGKFYTENPYQDESKFTFIYQEGFISIYRPIEGEIK